MIPGQTVYRAVTGTTVRNDGVLHCIYEGTVTDTVMDGEPVIRTGDILWRASEGWHETKSNALRHVANEIAVMVATLRKQVEEIRTGILNADDRKAGAA